MSDYATFPGLRLVYPIKQAANRHSTTAKVSVFSYFEN
jgi:hypothetical protein